MRMYKYVSALVLIWVMIAQADETQSKYLLDATYGRTVLGSMESLHEFEKSIQANYFESGIPVKIVQSFPAAPSFRIRFLKHLTKQSVGLSFSHSGSGGRIAYADYSGSTTDDYTLSNNNLGFVYRTLNLGNSKIRIYQSDQLNLKKSVFILEETLKIWDENSTDNLRVESLSYCFEPGLELEKTIWKGFSLGLYLSADIILYSNSFHLSGNKDAVLQFGNRQELIPDWIEFNAGIKLFVVTL